MKELIRELASRGIVINANGENLEIIDPFNRLTDELTQKIRNNKSQLLSFLNAGNTRETYHAIPKAASRDHYPLTPAQKRLLFLQELDPEGIAYNMPYALRLTGDLDFERIQDAFEHLINHHHSLKTCFREANGELRQLVVQTQPFALTRLESNCGSEDDVIKSFIRPFDLSEAPLFRAGILSKNEKEHLLLLDMHHLVTDGISQAVLIRDFTTFYRGDQPPEQAIQYVDYAVWKEEKHELSLKSSEEFWIREFEEEVEPLVFPKDHARPNHRKYLGSKVNFDLNEQQTERLKAIGASVGATLNMTLLAVFNVFIHKITDQKDIVVGTPVSGRTHNDLQGIVGLFLNTLALRNKVDPVHTFKQFLQELRDHSVKAFSNQDYSFSELIERLNVARDTRRNPLFDVMFTYRNFHEEALTIQGMHLAEEPLEHQVSKFDMELVATEGQSRLQLELEYSTELFNLETANRFVGYLQKIINSLIETPDSFIHEIDVLNEEERAELVSISTGPERDYPLKEGFLTCLLKQASTTPDQTAAIDQAGSITYQSLESHSRHLASALLTMGLKPEQSVLLHLDRSISYLIGIIGIMRAGGAYVPLSVDYPQQRKLTIIDDTESHFLITTSNFIETELLQEADQTPLKHLLLLDDGKVTLESSAITIDSLSDFDMLDHNELPEVTPEQLAYMIYTSGSSGKPKGVMIEQKGMLNHLFIKVEDLQLGSGSRVAQTASETFDISIWQFLTPLLKGGTVVIYKKDLIMDPAVLTSQLQKDSINVLELVPSYFAVWLAHLESHTTLPELKDLTYLMVTGETLQKSLLNKWLSLYPRIPVINAYGPTEASDDITHGHFDQAIITSPIPIGRVLPNLQVWVCDDHQHLLPKGVRGNIVVGGVGVGRGYRNRPDLTEKAFIKDPFSTNESRLYLTGDIGSWDSDGQLLFHGRRDEQVKIRGHRIELGEIERHLLEYEAIQEAIVMVIDHNENQYLVAYYVSKEAIMPSFLVSFLDEKLPENMIPVDYVHFNTFPLTTNGKVDRKQLGQVKLTLETGSVPPVSDEEKLLVKIWSEVLAVDQLGITDNFFSIGGDSIKSIQIRSRLRAEGYLMTVKDIFASQTISKLAPKLTQTTRQIEDKPATGVAQLSPIQQDFFKRPFENFNYYHQSVLLDLNSSFSKEQIQRIFIVLQTQHDALRFTFKQVDGEMIGRYGEIELPVSIQEFDLLQEENSGTLDQFVHEVHDSIDLFNGPIMNLGLIHDKDLSKLLIAIHHLAVDGISWRIILEDLNTLLEQQASGVNFELPARSGSYADWSNSLRSYSKGDEFRRWQDYWRDIVNYSMSSLLLDNATGGNSYKHVASRGNSLSNQETEKLLKMPEHLDVKAEELIMVSFLLAYRQQFGSCKLSIDLEAHGREESVSSVDVSRTVGWFTSIYPVLFTIEENTEDTLGWLREVKNLMRRVPNKGADFMIARQLGDLDESPLQSEILFNYLGVFDEIPGLHFKRAQEKSGNNHADENKRSHTWELISMIQGGKLEISLEYSNEQFESTTIESLIQGTMSTLSEIIEVCFTSNKSLAVPADYSYTNLTFPQVDELVRSLDLQDVYPLSPMQEGMLYHWLLEPEADHYFMQLSYAMIGHIDLEQIKKSFQIIVDRYDVLRTVIQHENGARPLQVVLKKQEVTFKVNDVRAEVKVTSKEEVLKKYLEIDKADKFNLSTGPMMRITAIRVDEAEHYFIWSHHHILMDGWCLGIIVNEFRQIYASLYQNQIPVLNEVVPYSNYIQWLEARDTITSIRFWKEYLQDFHEVTSLPKLVEKAGTDSHIRTELIINSLQSHAIAKLAEKTEVTINVVLQSIWALVLSRLNNTRDVLFGTVVSGRPPEVPGVEEMIGLFINTVPVRTQIEVRQSFRSLLQSLQHSALESEPHHYLPLSKIQAESELGTGLLNHIMIFDNYPIDEELLSLEEDDSGTYRVADIRNFVQNSYDLSVIVVPKEKIVIKFDYNESVYTTELIDQLKDYVASVIDTILKDPEILVDRIPMLLQAERETQLVEFNSGFNGSLSHPLQLMDQVRLDHPENPAVVAEDGTLTYQSLHECSDYWSYHLGAVAMTSKIVGIYLPPSCKMIVAMISTWKAGMNFLPLDPEHPIERTMSILKDSGCETLISNEVGKAQLSFEGEVLVLDCDEKLENFKSNVSGKDLDEIAYTIFTSGSTGKPKGVQVSHRNLTNYCDWLGNYLDLGPDSRSMLTSSYAFDLGYTSIFPVLLKGGQVNLVSSELYKSPDQLLKTIQEREISYLKLTPSLFSTFYDHENFGEATQSLNQVLLGGERLNYDHVKLASTLSPHLEFINHYGPTETTIGSIATRIQVEDLTATHPIIGQPISNTQCFIVGMHNNLLPMGVKGELMIAGYGLSPGYLSDPLLTKDKFIELPEVSEQVLYRTGDLACWMPNGKLQFFGREDHQIKIRGYRVELSEIEYVIGKQQAISEVIVLHRKEQELDMLIAYFTSRELVDISVLTSTLKSELPDYMLPAHFLQLEAMPLSGNGKIDRKALLQLEIEKEDYVAPRNTEEEILAQVWCEVLGAEQVSVTENFFAVGGDSIRSIQICSRVKKHGYKLTIKDVIQSQTIEKLALIMASRKLKGNDQIHQAFGEFPLTGVQSWFFEGPIYTKNHYNQSVVMDFESPIDAGTLQTAIAFLISHHDALRAKFSKVDGSWIQEVPSESGHIQILEKSFSDLGNMIPELSEFFDSIHRTIDLNKGELLKVGLAKTSSGDKVLMAIHHIIVDGVSWRILMEDFQLLLEQLNNGERLSLPPKTDPFKRWSEFNRQYLQKDQYRRNLSYWEGVLETTSGSLPVKEGDNRFSDQIQVHFELDKGKSQRLLREAFKAYNTQIDDLLLVGLIMAINMTFELDSIQIDMESHGREVDEDSLDFSRTIGWFTAIYPVILKLIEADDLGLLIQNVKENLRRVPNKGFDFLPAKYLDTSSSVIREANHSEILFSYLGQFDEEVKGKQFDITDQGSGKNANDQDNRPYKWTVSGRVVEECLQMSIFFSNQQFEIAQVQNFVSNYQLALTQIIDHCVDQKEPTLTPADLTYKDLSLSELHKLSAEYKLSDVYTLSPMQEGMLFLALMNNQADHYFQQLSFSLYGELLQEHVKTAYRKLVERYDVLRTVFIYEGIDQPIQMVLADFEADFRYMDIRKEVEGKDLKEEILKYREKDRSRKFQLDKGPLMRLTVYRVKEDQHEFIWSNHHILMDAWCRAILVDEFRVIYTNLISDQPIELSEVPKYSTYINWLTNMNREASRSYWEKYLEGYESIATLPSASVWKDKGKRERSTLQFSADTSDELQFLAQQSKVTLNTAIQCLWALLLSKYNGVNDVVFGSVVSGRPAEVEGIESMVGLFINTVPQRIEYDNNETFPSLAIRIQNEALESEAHHFHQLSEIQASSALGKSLIDHILVFDNHPVADNLEGISIGEVEDNRLSEVDVFVQNNYDLSLVIIPEDGLRIHFDFNPDRFSHETIENAKKHLSIIVSQIVDNPDMTLQDLVILTQDEASMKSLNPEPTPFPDQMSIPALFDKIVEEKPDSSALVFQEEVITYSELSQLVNSWAQLISEKAETLSLVALYFRPSIEMIAAVMAVLKTGKAFIPLDPEHQSSRMTETLTESGCKLVVAEEWLDFLEGYSGEILELDRESGHQVSNVDYSTDAEDAAYVIYTSGSTGKPKGVAVSHRSLVNYNTWFQQTANLRDEDRFLLTTSYAFDAIYTQLFGALLTGSELHILSREQYLSPPHLLQYISDKRITFLKMTPTLFNLLLNDHSYQARYFEGVRFLMLGGEAIISQDVDRLMQSNPKIQFMNHYGPTETTIGSIAQKIGSSNWDDFKNRPVLGNPISNTICVILDKQGQQLPVGCIGELAIGGEGLALEYVNAPELTAEKFIKASFDPDLRLYLTGDLARWLPNGTIEFLGRKDEQIKIRGYRVEPEEIRKNTLTFPDIKDAVIYKKDVNQSTSLVAYFVSDSEIDRSVLRTHLKSCLPDYMVPSYFVHIEKMPLTANGKIDKNALPPVVIESSDSHDPESPMEIMLAETWREVLGVKQVGVSSNFFELGGDSINSIQVRSRLLRQGFDLAIKDIFDFPSLREQALQISSLRKTLDQKPVTGLIRLSPIQMHFLQGNTSNKDHFNQSVRVRLKKSISTERLKVAFEQLMVHHDILRARFDDSSGEWIQSIDDEQVAIQVETIDKGDFQDGRQLEERLNQLQASLSLTQGNLVKVILLQSKADSELLIILHHLIIDGVSWRLLFEDLTLLLQSESVKLPMKTHSFQNWSEALMTYAESYRHRKFIPFWKDIQLQEADQFLLENLGKSTRREEDAISFKLSEEETHLLLTEVHRPFRTQVADMLIAALLQSLQASFGMKIVRIDMEGHGREDLGLGMDISRTIGWFTNIYPVIFNRNVKSPAEDLKSVKESLRKVPNAGMDYLIGRYVSHKVKDTQNSQIKFNYLGQVEQTGSEGPIELLNDFNGYERDQNDLSSYLWSVSAIVEQNQLELKITYSNRHFNREKMSVFSVMYNSKLSDLIQFCLNYQEEELTPSDMTYKGLTMAQLEQLQKL